MGNKYEEVINYINDIEAIKKTIEYEDFTVVVNEQVDFNDIFNAINVIVENIIEQEFAYELIDLMIPYYLLQLFTDIEPPMLQDDDGEEYPDFVTCYKIATYLNLEYELTQVSPIVAGYIYALTQNIWRRLDYKKSEGSYIKEQLTDALVHFYEVMDEVDDMVSQEAQVDIESFMEKLNEISEQLDIINNDTDIAEKSSIDLAIVDGDTK